MSVSRDAIPTRSVRVRGTDVALHLGPRTDRNLLLVHGGRASSAWWLPSLPFLSELGFGWTMLDLSGFGASGRRGEYRIATWADELSAAVAFLELTEADAIVAHSLGGAVALQRAAAVADGPASIIVDSAPLPRHLRPRLDEETPPFPTREDAISHFVAHPRRQDWDPTNARLVAEGFVVATDAGWTWNYDRVTRAHDSGMPAQPLDPSRPIRLVRGARSPLPIPTDHPTWAGRPVITVDTGHDVMAERPAEFAAAVESLY